MGCLAQMLAREGVCCYSATACVTTLGCYMAHEGYHGFVSFLWPAARRPRSAAERRPFFNFECCCRLFTSLLKTSPFLIEVILHTSFILFTGKRKPLAARRPKVPPGPATSYATRSLASSLLKTSIFIIFCTRAMANIDGNAARNGTNTYCKLGNPRAQPP